MYASPRVFLRVHRCFFWSGREPKTKAQHVLADAAEAEGRIPKGPLFLVNNPIPEKGRRILRGFFWGSTKITRISGPSNMDCPHMVGMQSSIPPRNSNLFRVQLHKPGFHVKPQHCFSQGFTSCTKKQSGYICSCFRRILFGLQKKPKATTGEAVCACGVCVRTETWTPQIAGCFPVWLP